VDETTTTTDRLADARNDGVATRTHVPFIPGGGGGPDGSLFIDELRNQAVLPKPGEAVLEMQLEQARCRAIEESSEDAIIGKTLDGTIIRWNWAAEKLYGYRAEEALGKSIGILFPPERSAELLEFLEKLKRGERIERHETVRVRKDGSRAQVVVSISPIQDSDGRIQGATAVTRDITARKRAEDAQRFLAEATSALSTSLDYETTLEGIAKLAVPTLADVCIVDTIEDQSVRQRSTAQAGAAYDECVRLVHARYSIDGDSPHPVLEVLRTGEPQLISDLSGCRLLSDQSDTGLLASLRDVGVESYMVVPLIIRGRPAGAISMMSVDPRRRYSQEDLTVATELAARAAVAVDNARLYRDAREAVMARDEFLSVAAHELRTPMTSLRGFVQLAMRQLDRDGTLDPGQVRQALKVIDHQSRKLSNLISQLLDVSRLEAGRLAVERRVVDVGRLVEGVVVAALATSTEHALVVRIPTTVLALVDPIRIEQVATNLIDNAIRYSPLGSLIDVEVWQPTRETISFAVRDRGPGIAAELRGQIFTRFNHAQGPDRAGGMGLGLYISREIVQLHGGEIEAEFPEDGGTRFVVTLPSGLSESESAANN
jgi:PAS domain S-box-containing protein